MSKIKLLSIAVVGLLVINLAMLVFMWLNKPGREQGAGPGGRHGGGHEGPKRFIIEKLHFDEGQVKNYEALINVHRAALHTLEDDIRRTKTSFYETLAGNATQYDSLQKRLGELQQQVEAAHYHHFAAIKTICRPEQMNDFNDMTKELARLFAPGKNLPPPPKD